MKISRIVNAAGYIDDELIIEAAESKKSTKRSTWPKWGISAACFTAIFIAGLTILPTLFHGNILQNGEGNRYKNFSVYKREIAIVWPWEYRTANEKYLSIEIEGAEYQISGGAVPQAVVEERIGSYTASGYDEYKEEKHTAKLEAYKLQNVAVNQSVAVKMDGNYFVFSKKEYDPPSTLGELLEQVDLPKVVQLSRFSEKSSSPDSRHFVLSDDDYVWDVLSDCKDAAFVEDQHWSVSGRKYLSFTVTSETLGIYRLAMYITEDGYLWTNAFRWRYLFYIGEDAAGEILRYVKKNSVKAEYEPYHNSVMGFVADITEEYILVDDTELCKKREDGIAYKIPLSDIRIARYVYCGEIKTGDLIQVSFDGDIDKEHENTLHNPVSISKVYISDGDVLIPE